MIGKRLGEYTVLARIGHGGMGVVYVAEDGRHQRVALKVLGERMDEGVALKRFAQELDTLKRVSHPRIVSPLSPLLEEEGQYYFAMELVPGRNLAELLNEVGRLEPADALRLASDALDGLIQAHAEGVLHRDVKCANLLLDAQGELKVCDFGLARAVDHHRQTMSGTLLGTPAFVSPEQARGLDARVESDVYSMGVVLYETLTGTLPFRAESPVALLRLHLETAPDPPSARRPGIPPELDALVLKAMAKDPEQRYRSAVEFKDAIDMVRAIVASAEVEEERPLAQALVQAIKSSTRSLDDRVQLGRVRRSGGVGIWFAAMLVLAIFAYGLLRVSESGYVPQAGVAPVTSQDALARRAEVEFANGAVHKGHLTELEGERLRLVEGELVMEFPSYLAVRVSYLEAAAPVAPVGTSVSTAPNDSGS